MVIFKNGRLKRKEKDIIIDLLFDFGYDKKYVANFLRLSDKGEKLSYSDNGFILTEGFKDKAPKIYLKIVATKLTEVNKLLRVLVWNLGNKNLFVLVKRNNNLKKCLYKNKFRNFELNGDYLTLLRKGEKNDRINS